jgi:hypothetical protein
VTPPGPTKGIPILKLRHGQRGYVTFAGRPAGVKHKTTCRSYRFLHVKPPGNIRGVRLSARLPVLRTNLRVCGRLAVTLVFPDSLIG